MKTIAVIPARYQSTRFPGKPLVPLLGKPMILWVAERTAKALGRENTYIATEDERIASVVREAGYQALMTDPDALTGTDRVAEVAQYVTADIYINVQGDEPMVNADDINKVKYKKIAYPNAIINAYCWMAEEEIVDSLNIPKVVTTEDDQLLYISRQALPGYKEKKYAPTRYKKQVCIYAYTANELRQFLHFGRKSYLEKIEDIEILRYFEMGLDIRMIEAQPGSLAVDVPEDVVLVESALEMLLCVS